MLSRKSKTPCCPIHLLPLPPCQLLGYLLPSCHCPFPSRDSARGPVRRYGVWSRPEELESETSTSAFTSPAALQLPSIPTPPTCPDNQLLQCPTPDTHSQTGVGHPAVSQALAGRKAMQRDSCGTATPLGSAKNAGKGVKGALRACSTDCLGQTRHSIGEVTFLSENWGWRSRGLLSGKGHGICYEGVKEQGAEGPAWGGLRWDTGGGDGCGLTCLGVNLSASIYYLCDFGQVT